MTQVRRWLGAPDVSWITVALSILVVAAIVAGCSTARCDAAARSDELEPATPWQLDLDWILSELPKRHVRPFTFMSRQRWMEEAAAIRAELAHANAAQSELALSRLVALLGDSHTAVLIARPGTPLSIRYPVRYSWIGDDLYVSGTTPEYATIMRGRVVALGGRSLAEAVAAVQVLKADENRWSRRSSVAAWLACALVLESLGIADAGGELTIDVQAPTGAIVSATLRPLAVNEAWSSVEWTWLSSEQREAVPPTLRRHEGWYWTYLFEPSTVFISYSDCANDNARPFKSFATETLELVDRVKAQRVILDLRYNGGGNEGLASGFLRDLLKRPALKRPGGFIVLTGPQTMSSARSHAIKLQQAGVILMGLPPGQGPMGFGELREVTLPATGLTLTYATSDRGLRPDSPHELRMDVMVEPTAEEFFAARDVALEAALR